MNGSSVWLGVDVGTQGVRVVAVDQTGGVLASARRILPLNRPDAAVSEQDAQGWFNSVIECLAQVAGALPAGTRAAAIGVTATSGTLVLAGADLDPVAPAMMWNDKRAVVEAARAAAVLGDPTIRPGFTVAKAMWAREHWPQTWSRARWLLSAGDWLIARLTGGEPVTDPTNALKSGADLIRLEWPVGLELLGIERAKLPRIVPTGSIAGSLVRSVSRQTGISESTPVIVCVTDATSAQIAAGAVHVGDWVTTIGTGLSLKGVTPGRIVDSGGSFYSHRHWSTGWIPTGTSHCGADAIATRFRAEDLEALTMGCLESPSSTLVLPLVTTGEYFPFWAPEARGFEVGAPRDRADLFRGYLEGIAFVERLGMDRMLREGALVSGPQRTMGGGSANELWMRIRAAVLARPTARPLQTSSAFGAAVVAAAEGLDLTRAVERMTRLEHVFEPEPFLATFYEARYAEFVGELVSRGYIDLPAA